MGHFLSRIRSIVKRIPGAVALRRFWARKRLQRQARWYRRSVIASWQTSDRCPSLVRMPFGLDDLAGYLWVFADDLRVYLISRKRQDYKMRYLRSRVRALGPSQFIDIGANYGEFTWAMQHEVLKVWSIEPNPVVGLALSESFSGSSNVEVITAGVSATPGLSIFCFNLFYSGGGGLSVSKNMTNSYGQFSTLVRCVSPEELMKQVLRVDGSLVFKIDVEGHDFVLLSHLFQSLISCQRGFLILVEYVPAYLDGSQELVRDVLRRFLAVGCSLGVLMDGGDVRALESFDGLDTLGICELVIERASHNLDSRSM